MNEPRTTNAGIQNGEGPHTPMSTADLVDRLNEALGWELRAMTMYAHYAANVQGIHRLQLDPMFN